MVYKDRGDSQFFQSISSSITPSNLLLLLQTTTNQTNTFTSNQIKSTCLISVSYLPFLTIYYDLHFTHRSPNIIIRLKGRKSMTEQVGDKMKPDSQKTTTEKMGDTTSGVYDRAAGAVQPDSQKSTSQTMGDKMRGGSDTASNQGKSMTENISDTVSNAAQNVKDTVSGNKH